MPIKDLPGQALLFPEEDLLHAGCTAPAKGAQADEAPAALGLPNKATCTVGEAHRHTGISKRQLRYYIEDGSLLAVNSARVPVGKTAGARRGGKLDRWRIVVRRTDIFKTDGYKPFQTLEEFISARLNKESN